MEGNNVRQLQPPNYNHLTAIASKLAAEQKKENYVKRLQGKWVVRSFYEKYIGITRLSSPISILLNLFFVSVAVYCAATLTSLSSVEGYIVLIGAILFFGLVEFGKRKISDTFFDDLFALTVFSGFSLVGWLICFCISAGFGVWGVMRANDNLTGPDPALVSIQNQVTDNKAQIAKIEADIASIKSDPSSIVRGGKDNGKIRYNAEKQVTSLTASLAELRSQTTTLSGQIAGKTKYFEKGYQEGVKLQGYALGGLFFGLEILLLCLMAWRSYFDHKVQLETDPQGYIDYVKYRLKENPYIQAKIVQKENFQ